jgi:phosphatidylglycerol---prolipoprotein diacylglyceryl transferase
LWPVFLKLGPLPINTFGVVLVIAFLVGTWYITRDGARQGLDPEQIQSLCWMVLGAIVIGGRVMFIITTPGPYLDNPLRVFAIWEGGLVYYGGFLATVGTVMWFAWKHGLPIWKLTDLFTVGGMLGLGIGRFSCFFAGDDHGRVIPGTLALDGAGRPLVESTPLIANHLVARAQEIAWYDLPGKLAHDIPWYAVKFKETVGPWDAHPALSDLRWADLWLYPTQWMMSLKAFILFLGLAYLSKRKKFDGQLTAVLLMGYAVLRSLVELWRGDVDRGVYLQPDRAITLYSLGLDSYPGFYLTTAQITSIILFALGAWLYVAKRKDGVEVVTTPKAKAAGAKAEDQVSSGEEARSQATKSKDPSKRSKKR